MAQLNTRIVLRNDTHAAWLENSNQVLAKGELAIEFDPSVMNTSNEKVDYKVRVKIGDGVSSWGELPYFCDSVEYNEKAFAMINGKLDLLGLASAEVGAQLVKAADGSLSWVKPDNTTVEGITTTLETLLAIINGTVDENGNSNNDGLIHRVALLEKSKEENSEANETRDEKIEALEQAIENVYSKEETNTAIATAVVEAGHLKRVIVSKEQIEVFQANPISAEKNIIYMVKINSLLKDAYSEYMRFDSDLGNVTFEQIGDTSVDLAGYAKTEYVDTLTGQIEEELEERLTPVEKAIETLPDNFLTKEEAKEVLSYDKYEISHKPEGTLVNIKDEEIRIMCPQNTNWQLQNSGAGADANLYYIGFKAYAPNDEIHSFKEDLAEIIADNTMYYFENNDFAGTDENGRKFSIVWLPVALYNQETQTWTYYGTSSTTKKYIGWYYSVEWYNAAGVKVASDCIRINLSNENCHNVAEPYYMGAINVNKLVQNENEFLILYGGSASDNI